MNPEKPLRASERVLNPQEDHAWIGERDKRERGERGTKPLKCPLILLALTQCFPGLKTQIHALRSATVCCWRVVDSCELCEISSPASKKREARSKPKAWTILDNANKKRREFFSLSIKWETADPIFLACLYWDKYFVLRHSRSVNTTANITCQHLINAHSLRLNLFTVRFGALVSSKLSKHFLGHVHF